MGGRFQVGAGWRNVMIHGALLEKASPAKRLSLSAFAILLVACPQKPSPPKPSLAGGPTSSSSPSLPSSTNLKCSPRNYDYGLADEGAQGAVILDAHATYRSGSACIVSDRVVVTLTDSRGHRLMVEGNPATATLGGIVSQSGVDSTHPVLLAWRNWCSSGSTSFAFTVTSLLGTRHHTWTGSEPSCVDPSKGSTLTPFTSSG